jgi:hypothetical protein
MTRLQECAGVLSAGIPGIVITLYIIQAYRDPCWAFLFVEREKRRRGRKRKKNRVNFYDLVSALFNSR